MPLRLLLAFAVSLLLHGAAFLPEIVARRPPPAPPPLQARLAVPPPAPEPAEALLKNTLDAETPTPEAQPARPPAPPQAASRGPSKPTPQKQTQAVQRKLSKYVFYPEYARANNIQGTVFLYLEISADGNIEDVRIAQSSGFSILDNAAATGAWALQKFPGIKSGVYDYQFKLVD